MKKKTRKIGLNKETLRNLGNNKLGVVAGGTSETCPALCGKTVLCSDVICCSLTGGSAACSVLPPFTCAH